MQAAPKLIAARFSKKGMGKSPSPSALTVLHTLSVTKRGTRCR